MMEMFTSRAGKVSSRAAGGFSAVAVIGMIGAAITVDPDMVRRWEGRRLNPYQDIVGVWTVCYGETRNIERRRYSVAECNEMLYRAKFEDFGPAVINCTPGIADNPPVLLASISLAYNIGTGAYCRSTVARRFNAGDIRGGCDAFIMWRFAGGREVRGLLNRRNDERRICLQGVAS
jgi:lysozyme